MKTNILLIALMSISTILFGQVPQGIPYQAVTRDAQGNPMSNQSLTVQFSLHEASADGQVVYQETQTTTTNGQGLFSVTFGAGVPSVGTFANINWGSGYKFLQVQANFGNGYVDLGTQQLMSVPYALYSGSSGNGTNGQNSNYNPSADSVLTLIGKVTLTPGTYQIPTGETWELESFNDDGNSNPTMDAEFFNCEFSSGSFVNCVYAVPEDNILVFSLDGWEFNVSGGFSQGMVLPNGQIAFRYTKGMVTTNYDCSVCGTSAQYTFPTNLTAINLNLPIYANSGQQLFIQNGFRVSVSKYK